MLRGGGARLLARPGSYAVATTAATAGEAACGPLATLIGCIDACKTRLAQAEQNTSVVGAAERMVSAAIAANPSRGETNPALIRRFLPLYFSIKVCETPISFALLRGVSCWFSLPLLRPLVGGA